MENLSPALGGPPAPAQKWTRFWDMHGGGRPKHPPLEQIYIEAPEDEAKRVFFAKIGTSPENMSCSCCGEDFAIDEFDSLEEAIYYHSNGRAIFKVEGSYLEHPSVRVIRANEITEAVAY